MAGMARALTSQGWDVISWNFRGCSEEPNRLMRTYHSGATEDLHAVVEHGIRRGGYATIGVLGFSLGGNLTLKYLGELGEHHDRVQVGMAISVPCDLRGAAERLDSPDRRFYLRRFINSMRRRMAEKERQFGSRFPSDAARPCRTFREFDDQFTAPLHGYRDASDYWERCSANRFLEAIRIPTLILNACDDPFLSAGCYPIELARNHPWVHLETPQGGGHVGFVAGTLGSPLYWAERRAVEFFERIHPPEGIHGLCRPV